MLEELSSKEINNYLDKDVNVCVVCGSDDRVGFNGKLQKYLCNRHNKQVWKYGEITDPRRSRDDDILFVYDDYAIIKMYNAFGKYYSEFIIDKEDIDLAMQYKWGIAKGHICAKDFDNRTIYLHRLLMGCEHGDGKVVDHIDRNPLNNRKSNLRFCNIQQNDFNHGIARNNTSGITGVTWNKERNKWQAQIVFNNKNINLGRFDTLEEAAKIRREAEIKYYGEYAVNYNQEHNDMKE